MRMRLLGTTLAAALVGVSSAHAASHRHTVATARAGSVAVYARPGASRPRLALESPNAFGVARAFLVTGRRGRWLHVLLPTRPNGSSGWIRARDVRLAADDYRVDVDLERHRLSLWQGSRSLGWTTIGAGKPSTPTPRGRFYVTETIRIVGAAQGSYGPYVLGLSAHSEALRTFGGGDAQIAIHGTNDPASIGADRSNGCVHVRNEDVAILAEVLPLGTPVTIH